MDFAEFTQPGTTHGFVVPDGVTKIQVELWGGGGGGGSAGFYSGGGGGGGGGYFRGVMPVTPGEWLGIWVGHYGLGDPGCGLNDSATDGGDTAIWNSGTSFIRAKGGYRGDDTADGFSGGAGGSPGGCEISYPGLTSAACRWGGWGTWGGTHGAFVPGGRTPNGSSDLPDGDGGGVGGHRAICEAGQRGNTGYVLISW